MKLLLLAIGRTTTPWINQGLSHYIDRLSHYAPFEMQVIPDVKMAKNSSQDNLKAKEGQAIMQFIAPNDTVILLDERGKEYTSTEFATLLQSRMSSGIKRLVFVIGGPYGFSQEIYNRANAKLSLSRMTLTHEMVRLFFIEQLYRAQTILKGEPYHHT